MGRILVQLVFTGCTCNDAAIETGQRPTQPEEYPMTKAQLATAAYDNALACALEIFKDDVNLMVDYPHFELVMWPDDFDLKEYQMSREDYGDMLKRVFNAMDRQQEEALRHG
jgi:hypothetical protein